MLFLLSENLDYQYRRYLASDLLQLTQHLQPAFGAVHHIHALDGGELTDPAQLGEGQEVVLCGRRPFRMLPYPQILSQAERELQMKEQAAAAVVRPLISFSFCSFVMHTCRS